jgi:DNA-binding IclR family transcriptional regulator
VAVLEPGQALNLENKDNKERGSQAVHRVLRILLCWTDDDSTLKIAFGVGRTSPLPDGASGRILVAWSDERLEIAQRRLEETGGRRGDLDVVLKEVRENRYAMSEGETIPGASAVAFPLFGPNKDVRSAVNVTGPAGRWTKTEMLSDCRS